MKNILIRSLMFLNDVALGTVQRQAQWFIHSFHVPQLFEDPECGGACLVCLLGFCCSQFRPSDSHFG